MPSPLEMPQDDPEQAAGRPAEPPVDQQADEQSPREAATKLRKKRRRRVLLAVLLLLLLVITSLVGLVWQRQSSYNGNIDRIPNALPTNADRPQPSVVGSENWLLVGSDTRDEGGTTGDGGEIWRAGGQRSDTIMLLHLPADRDKAYVISFPRDSWVTIPGYGPQKINAAFSYGGPQLLIRSVESLTGIRVDHFGAIDFDGFKSMTDALGGVEVEIAQTVHDSANNVTWQAGRQRLDGERALLFVRQRYGLSGGDFDRIKRQQAFLRALAKKAADSGTVTNPLKLDGFLTAFTKSISVDESVDAGKLRSLAVSLRGLRVGDVSFLTLPNRGSARRGAQSVVLVDRAKAAQLYEAVRTDAMTEYVTKHGGTNSVGKVS